MPRVTGRGPGEHLWRTSHCQAESHHGSFTISGGGPVPVAGLPALEARLPHLEQLAHPRLSVDGRPFPVLRLIAQRAFFRALRPYWFQQGRFHTELLAAVHQVAAALRDGQTNLDTVEGKFRELTRALNSSTSDVRTVEGRLAVSAADQWELKDRQGRTECRMESVETGINRLSMAAKTMQDRQRELKPSRLVLRPGPRRSRAG
jgi:hypothetical protein